METFRIPGACHMITSMFWLIFFTERHDKDVLERLAFKIFYNTFDI